MSDEAKKAAIEKIAESLKIAQEKIEEAQALADEHALEFTWDLAYGMGGTYEGKGVMYGWGKDKKPRTEGEWVSSSSTC